MNRRAYTMILAFASVLLAFGFLTGCSSSSSTPPTISIAATSGGGQSTTVNTAFTKPLIATVTSNGTPASGVTVTFSPVPANGASCTLSSTTATTGVSGTASVNCTANTTAGSYSVTATTTGATTPATFSLTNNAGPAATIAATSGGGQSATVNTAFTNPLLATVADTYSNPVSNATVTFSAPATTGASCTPSSGTVTTGTNGTASVTCTADTVAGAYAVTATTTGVTTPASYTLTNNPGTPLITATSGTPQSAAVGRAFLKPLVATVADSYGNPYSNVSVTFTAPARGASGTFATTPAAATDTVTTNTSGVATSQVFTANSTVGGPYTVTATTTGAASPADFDLTNGAVYTFYLSGLEPANTNNDNTTSYYALAGAVIIDPNGAVVGGEQDYNDGGLITSAPGGDSITGGTLAVDSTTGQGTLTLITNDQYVGVNGSEKLAVQFANASHALISQFDGTATSSGSMDLQTDVAPTGNFAFILSGTDTNEGPVGYGGVITIASGTPSDPITGTVDVNDDGTVTAGDTFSAGSIFPADTYGRGEATVVTTITATTLSLAYYIVGPEVIRIIDIDNTPFINGVGNAAVGSAYGQGTTAGAANTFSNASLGTSVFGLEGSPTGYPYAAVGMFTTNPTAGTFQGAGEDDLEGAIGSVDTIAGSYTVGSNGYTSIDDVSGLTGITKMGMYMTDPTLNLLDPNNQSNGGGEALFLAMDTNLSGGTGFVIPQTDTSTADFNGDYAFGAQYYDNWMEFDLVGLGSVSGLALTGTGLISDPFGALATPGTEYPDASFSGTAVADTTNLGRYTISPLNFYPTGMSTPCNCFDVVVYQASGDQLVWMDEDTTSLSLGTLQQQGSLTGIPAAKKPVAKNPRAQHKH